MVEIATAEGLEGELTREFELAVSASDHGVARE
jgi:hypothetical protein